MSEGEEHTLVDEEGIPVWDPNLHDENYVPLWDRDLHGKTLEELTKLSLSVALRVLSLAKNDPEEAKKFFRKSGVIPVPRFLSKTEISLRPRCCSKLGGSGMIIAVLKAALP
tara:strand:- start:356 stop:691 length:336 start_codon:yes stop_codon:yes gene_type:complete